MNRILAGAILTAALHVASAAWAAEFRWPTAFTDGAVPPIDASLVLGRPDGRVADFRGGDCAATYRNFTAVEPYDPAALAAALGVAPDLVVAADFIAFEAWGVSFELSTWTFSAGGVTHAVEAPGDALAFGTITSATYAAFFGLQAGIDPLDEWQFALLDTGPVDVLAADFAVEIQRGDGPYGSPDLDAIGAMTGGAVPAAGATWSGVRALYR